MTIIKSKLTKGQLTLTLPEMLDIPASGALRETVLKSVKPEQTVKLNCAEVTQVTSPGVQMLIAVAEYVGRQKARFVIASPSDALVEAFGDLGLFSQLMAWDAE
jgi:anti-anti-sigma regulatory factor